MKKLAHGGDIYSKRALLENKKIIDFSANINPLGLPLGVKRAIIDNIDDFSNYPDPLCRTLIHEISKYENIPPEYVVCGNGAADIIYRIAGAIKPRATLLTAPAFSEYEEAVKTVNSNIRYHYLIENNQFKLDESIFKMITPDIDVMFLCNPNNPTGVLIEKEMMLKIADKCKTNNIVLVVDECFIEFVEYSKDYSIVDNLYALENVIVLKAFTKIYAMAGIRLGYGICSNQHIIDMIYNAGQPWSVSVIAQKCGVAAVKEREYVKQTQLLIMENKKYLMEQMSLLGLRVFDSEANYILFKCENKLLHRELEKYGILIRSCSNYVGLDDTYFRIAVKAKEDNEYLINSLERIIK